MQNTFTFDIETVPLKDMTEIQIEELEKRLTTIKNKENVTPEEIDQERRKISGTSPFFGMIVCIGIRLDQNGVFDSKVLKADNYDLKAEKKMLEEFWEIASKDKWLFVGFNSLDFDAYFIIRRSAFHNITPSNKFFLSTNPWTHTVHFDLMKVLTASKWREHISLKAACDFFNIPSPKEGEVVASEVAEYYENGKLDAIADYCLRDISATHALYNKVRKYVFIPSYK